ncbi:MAG TPA: aminomethyl-transferring glycine dehydrogenase subunit GcvPB, partial [Acidimicrobiales bacterium]|nr:aminomethyl-transferring glycine dehydrogenase subunit GcvPB [Acidimicrobiales bacterium]
FELSHPGRRAWQLRTTAVPELALEDLVPAAHRRDKPPALAEVSERDLVAHFTRLSHRQFSVDLGAYPLGSCTMKYNPKICDAVAGLPGLANVHPGAPASCTQGWLELLVELEAMLCEVTGMAAATLQPAAGAAGELTGLLLMRAWHEAQGRARTKVIIPDSAHGTNPASVTLGGYETVTVPSDERGCVDLDALRRVLDDDVAGIMLTNPNTLGLFEEQIVDIAAAVHEVGGLLYYDGANLNAILGVVRPGDMGFDIVHLNLHKTFATPHGGGGPGAGPVAVSERLVPFLPGPRPSRLPADGDGPRFGWSVPERSIGRVHSWHGNALVLARALTYILVHGADGLRQVAQLAVLNANWLRARLSATYDTPYDRPCMHEFVLSAAGLKRQSGVKALDVGKRLLEEGFHAPTVYFPLIVEEALMIEPTETESPQTLAALAEALERIASEARTEGSASAVAAPRTTPVRRVDEARAARTLVPTFDARP